jgi:hypothetical protein
MLIRCLVQMLTLQELRIPHSFNAHLVCKCITVIIKNFSLHHLCNISASVISVGVFGYIDVIYPKERSPEVWQHLLKHPYNVVCQA